MSDIDYKEKYLDLRDKFLRSTDVAWRLGYEQGLKDSQVQQAQQQMQQAQQMAQMQAGQPGQQPQDPNQQPQQDPNAQQQDPNQGPDMGQEGQVDPNADHLGQSMDELGQTVQKSEAVSRSRLSDFNLDNNSKKSHNMQKKIVDDILLKWEKEAPRTIDEILKATKNV